MIERSLAYLDEFPNYYDNVERIEEGVIDMILYGILKQP